MSNVTYTNIIAEIVTVESMVTDCVDTREEQDYYGEQAQRSLEYFAEECNSITELLAVKGVAETFRYNTLLIEKRIAYLEKKAQLTAHFDFEFEMATQQREEEKHHHIESLFVAYEATQAALQV